MVTALSARLTRSGSVVVPKVLPVNRTDSTSTYPFTLVMVSPPDAAECRKVTVSDMIIFFCRVVSWATFRVLDRGSALSHSQSAGQSGRVGDQERSPNRSSTCCCSYFEICRRDSQIPI